MNLNKIIREIYDEVLLMNDIGQIADYIPLLSEVDTRKFGINLITLDSKNNSFGNSDEKFSIQSIAKIFSLTLAYKIEGEKLWERVGNTHIAESEKLTGYKNAASINLMKSFGNIINDVDEVLDFYFHLCSIEMTCKELSQTFLFFANAGKLLDTDEQIISESKTKRINAIMQTCGFYDEAGEFSFKVGLPGKSGVGGGIVAWLILIRN